MTDREFAREPGLLPYIYVDRIEAAVGKVTALGGEVVRAPYPEGNVRVALVRDPAGSVIGLWQEARGNVPEAKEETTMSAKATDLARRLDQVNGEAIDFVERCADEDWRRLVPNEQRSVAYLCGHIAFGYVAEGRAVHLAISGQPLPTVTVEEMAQRNLQRWERDPYPSRAVVVNRLREDGKALVEMIAGLGDADLARSFRYAWLPEMSIEAFIERVVLGHPRGHLDGIREMLESGRPG